MVDVSVPFPSAQKIARRLNRGRQLVQHMGFASRCSFCGFPARRLLPIGGDTRAAPGETMIGCGPRLGGCPRCGASDRERLVHAYLQKVFRLAERAPTLRVLHMAPEPRLTEVFRNADVQHYVRADNGVSGHDFGNDIVHADHIELPFAPAAFDLILCNHVLEHITDDRKAMSELFRVLAPGGLAILQVPIAPGRAATYENPRIVTPAARALMYGQFDHVRVYGQDYPDRLAEAGFVVEVSTLAKTIRRLGVNPDERLFLARRPAAPPRPDTPPSR